MSKSADGNYFNRIQDFGEAAENFALSYENADWSDVLEQYEGLNPSHDPSLAQAVNLELRERGLLPAISISNGNLRVSESDLANNQEEMQRRNAVESFGMNEFKLRTVASLTHAGEFQQASRNDIEAALVEGEERFTAGEIAALEYLRDRYDDVNIIGISNGEGLSTYDIREYAAKKGTYRTEILRNERTTDDAQVELIDRYLEEQEERNELNRRFLAREQRGNVVHSFGTSEDRLRVVADLTSHGEDGQVSMEDIEAAIDAGEDMFTENEIAALHFLRKNFDSIHTDGWMNGNDISLEELREYFFN